MRLRTSLEGVLPVLLLFLLPGIVYSLGEKEPVVQTRWSRSDGMRVDDDLYFLSSYGIYQPGKVIVPMFIVTDPHYFFSDLSLYRLSEEDELVRVWSPDARGIIGAVDLKSCRFARRGDWLHSSWPGAWDDENKERLQRVLSYDLQEKVGRLLEDQPGEVTDSLEYHPDDGVKESELWRRAGLIPLAGWGLPSPLEYTSRAPAFLKRIILKKLGDRELRAAALAELDSRGEEQMLREMLREFEGANRTDGNGDGAIYAAKWEILIGMSRTLRGDEGPNIFTAAFDNDVRRLGVFLDHGADPDSCDEAGRSLLSYAVLGGATETMELLFAAGADPVLEGRNGVYPWLYAAVNPLRHRFLELWGKVPVDD